MSSPPRNRAAYNAAPKNARAEQESQIQRVSERIGTAIIDFCRSHSTFHADQLRQHVTRVVGNVAPGSADRILRDLRQRGVVSYTVLDRRKSLYSIGGNTP